MDASWDPQKARANVSKHGVLFEDAELALADPLALTREDPDGEDEQRFITVGADALGRIVTVVFGYRDSEVRLISARRATRRERDSYARGV